MTQTTISETLFESLCSLRGVRFERIPVAAHPTPDYEIALGVHKLLVEVKQLDQNATDKRVNKSFDTAGETDGVVSPAARLREQIARAYRQLKMAATQGQPCLLVIYNNSGFLNFIDSFTVTTAMFGRYGVRFGLSRIGEIRETGRGFTGKAPLTRNTCKSLSAIGILKHAQSGNLRLEVYHNPFALVPIEPRAMALLATEQFRHPSPHAGISVDWEPSQIGA